jgi:hypothetical protein
LLHHLLRYGSERVVESAREHTYDLRSLERFEFIDAKGKDQGINGALFLCGGFLSFLIFVVVCFAVACWRDTR